MSLSTIPVTVPEAGPGEPFSVPAARSRYVRLSGVSAAGAEFFVEVEGDAGWAPVPLHFKGDFVQSMTEDGHFQLPTDPAVFRLNRAATGSGLVTGEVFIR